MAEIMACKASYTLANPFGSAGNWTHGRYQLRKVYHVLCGEWGT